MPQIEPLVILFLFLIFSFSGIGTDIIFFLFSLFIPH